jgi:dCTP deaminase
VGLFSSSIGRENPLTTGKGILPSQDIREFIKIGRIRSSVEIPAGQIQPASIDLRLGRVAYRVRASFLPGRSSTVLSKAKDLLISEIDLTQSALFEPGAVFIVPLIESLDLPSDVQGLANPKSTTGRLDIFVRLITEYGGEFERVPKGYSGNLYAEIVSRTFPVRVRAGMRLNQLRFIRGNAAPTGDGRLEELDRGESLVYGDEQKSGIAEINRGLAITVDLQGNGKSNIIAYKAKGHAPVIDLEKVRHYGMDDFWTAIPRAAGGRLILEPSGFYLLASVHRVRVPPDHAAELVAFDPTMGEFRIHYAGFFDPGFGYGANGEISGTKAVLEVRAYELPILLEHDQLVGRLNYFRMASIPEQVYGVSIGSSYQQQELTPSKQFKTPGIPTTVVSEVATM